MGASRRYFSAAASTRARSSAISSTRSSWAATGAAKAPSIARRDRVLMAVRNSHWFSAIAILAVSSTVSVPPSIPLAEHPRPDFERQEWLNLNGPWQFQLDAQNAGE